MHDEQNYNRVLGTYNMVNPFDENQKDRIKNLLKLNGICIYQHKILCNLSKNTESDGAQSFFSSIVDISNVVLTWQIFDEISASLDNRGPLSELIGDVKKNAQGDIQENPALNIPYEMAFNDLECRTFSPQLMYTNFINGSMFQDFIVGTFSAFEYWMSEIYDHLFDASCAIDRRKAKVTKMIGDKKNNIINEDDRAVIESWLARVQDQISDEIIKKFGSYVSSSEKIEIVISHVNKKYGQELKDLGVDPIEKEDRDLIKFYATQRNAIHNLGKHSKSSNLCFYDVTIEAGKPSYYKDYNDNINLCLDLIVIFIKVITILEIDRELLLEGVDC